MLQVKKLFDELVRDVHQEESQIKLRLEGDLIFARKTVTITSRYIFVSRDNTSDEEALLGQISHVNIISSASSSVE
jgi:hypothetical protein